MLLDEVGGRLSTAGIASSSGSGTGWYLWLGRLPDSTGTADRAVALFETGGLAQLPNIEIDQPTFQVVVRGARMNQVSSSYQEARQKAEDISLDLHFRVRATLSGTYYNGIVAEQAVMFLGEDENQRPLFSQNFKAWKESTA